MSLLKHTTQTAESILQARCGVYLPGLLEPAHHRRTLCRPSCVDPPVAANTPSTAWLTSAPCSAAHAFTQQPPHTPHPTHTRLSSRRPPGPIGHMVHVDGSPVSPVHPRCCWTLPLVGRVPALSLEPPDSIRLLAIAPHASVANYIFILNHRRCANLLHQLASKQLLLERHVLLLQAQHVACSMAWAVRVVSVLGWQGTVMRGVCTGIAVLRLGERGSVQMSGTQVQAQIAFLCRHTAGTLLTSMTPVQQAQHATASITARCAAFTDSLWC
jgi:hypothetical protein